MAKQTYKYKKEKSIIYGLEDDYSLSEIEYYYLYSFYVTYSMCGSQSYKKKSFEFYGWDTHTLEKMDGGHREKTLLGKSLYDVIDFDKNRRNFCFDEETELKELFKIFDLEDNTHNYNVERAVIGKTSESNKYLKFFYRIRDGFAHGKFALKYSSIGEKMIVMQDNDSTNVTARIVIKLSTLLKFVKAVDLKGFIVKNVREIFLG